MVDLSIFPYIATAIFICVLVYKYTHIFYSILLHDCYSFVNSFLLLECCFSSYQFSFVCIFLLYLLLLCFHPLVKSVFLNLVLLIQFKTLF